MIFLKQIETPGNLDLRTAFLAPFQGISFLLSRPFLLFKVLLCSVAIVLSLPVFILNFFTIPIFLCLIMLMIINDIEGDNLSFAEIMTLVYTNIKIKVKSFIFMSFPALLFILYILHSIENFSNSVLIYEMFGLLCFLNIWGLITANALLISSKNNSTLLNSVTDSLNLLVSKPFVFFSQLIIWTMGLMFTLAVLGAYILILPSVGVAHGSLLEMVMVILITFIAVCVYLAFYISGITVLLYHWYGKTSQQSEDTADS